MITNDHKTDRHGRVLVFVCASAGVREAHEGAFVVRALPTDTAEWPLQLVSLFFTKKKIGGARCETLC